MRSEQKRTAFLAVPTVTAGVKPTKPTSSVRQVSRQGVTNNFGQIKYGLYTSITPVELPTGNLTVFNL